MYSLFVVSINVLSCGLSCYLSFVPDLSQSHIDDHNSSYLPFILRAHQAGCGSLNARGTKAPVPVRCSHLNAQFNHV